MKRHDAKASPLSQQRLYQIVARQIVQLIEQNADTENWQLPSERELAEELKVSRASVREAVIALEMRGIVEVRGRAGIVILPQRTSEINFDAINTDIGPGPFELMEARKAVESSAASIAAHRATPYDIAELEDYVERMIANDGDVQLTEQIDRDFHMTIANMTGNAIIVSMVDALWAQSESSPMWKKLREYIHTDTNKPMWIGDHTGILAALKSRNADAAYKAMSNHISRVANELLDADDQGRFAD